MWLHDLCLEKEQLGVGAGSIGHSMLGTNEHGHEHHLVERHLDRVQHGLADDLDHRLGRQAKPGRFAHDARCHHTERLDRKVERVLAGVLDHDRCCRANRIETDAGCEAQIAGQCRGAELGILSQ